MDSLWSNSSSKSSLDLRLDMLNCDAIFTVKRIRSTKSMKELEAFEAEYKGVTEALLAMIEELHVHPKTATLSIRSAVKRIKYALDYVRREHNSKKLKLERAILSSKHAKNTLGTKNSAALLAKFLVNETLKIQAKYPPRFDTGLRTNTAPEDAYTNARTLSSILPDIDEEILNQNPLEDMDQML